MEKPIRVLQIGDWEFGKNGIATIVYNIFQVIDNKKIIFDFLVTNEIEEVFYKKEIENKLGKIYELKIKTKGIRKKIDIFFRSIKFLKENKFEIVHIHESTSYMMLFYGIIVRMCGIKKIILHSHSSGLDSNNRIIKYILHIVAKQFIPFITQNYMACSKVAAKWIFKSKYLPNIKIIYNGISTEKFKFDSKIRKKIRAQLGVEKNFIVGHVGRFSYQKNHKFILEVFKELKKEKKDSKLLLIGKGALKDIIEKKAKEDCIFQDIIFIEKTKKVEEYYQIMDIFLLPSYFEGLAIVGIEAQVSGLPCIFSSYISKEIEITDLCQFLSLKDKKEWMKKIIEIEKKVKKITRQEYAEKVRETRYELRECSKELENFYLK